MDAPRNLTHLRRFLAIGMVLRRQHSRPELQHGCPVATVDKVQGNGFFYRNAEGKRLWHEFQLAKQYTFDPQGFTVELGGQYGSVRYEYVSRWD